MDLSKRFEINQQLGEGSFSKIYQAHDKKLKLDVALKVEKEDKHKKILKFEYEILKNLQGLKHVPKLYDFIENSNKSIMFNEKEVEKTNGKEKIIKYNLHQMINSNIQNVNSNKEGLNFIVMELLGKNVANYKKSKQNFEALSAYEVLIQMLEAIESLHDRGYIHRDIKPTNFVVKENNYNKSKISEVEIYMVDFGLAKIHLDRFSRPIPQRVNTDFRGTLTYASLNAHYKKELSRRDDLWSFFFVILDLLNENLPWRTCKDKDDIKKMKEVCLADPEKKLLVTTTKGKKEIFLILNHLKMLSYDDRPNYYLIKTKLFDLRNIEICKLSKFNSNMNASLNNISNLMNGSTNITSNNIANNILSNNINPNCIIYEPPSQENILLQQIMLGNANGINQNVGGNINNVIQNLNQNGNYLNNVNSKTNSNFSINNNYSNKNFNTNLNMNANGNGNVNANNTNFNIGGINFNLPQNNSGVNNINTLDNLNNNLNNNLKNNANDAQGNNINNNFLNSFYNNNLPSNLQNNLVNNLNNNLSNNPLSYFYNSNNYLENFKNNYLDSLFNNVSNNLNRPSTTGINQNNQFNVNNNLVDNLNNFYGGLSGNFIDSLTPPTNQGINFNHYMSLSDINNFTNYYANNLNNQNIPKSIFNNSNVNASELQNINFNNPLNLNNQINPNINSGNVMPNISNNLMPNNNMNNNLNNNFTNKKRNRENFSEELPEDKKKYNPTTSQQRNQIFIINQFYKNNLADLDKQLLLEMLLKYNNNNIQNSSNNIINPTEKKANNKTVNKSEKRKSEYNINSNDKLLIDSITKKLKPTQINNKNSLDNDSNINEILNQICSSNDFLNNINNIINNVNSNEVNKMVQNIITRNPSLNNGLNLDENDVKNKIEALNNFENLNKFNSLLYANFMNSATLINNNQNNNQNNEIIFKIEKKKKKKINL